ncbi:inositol monophosphatase family protein [soil metagenome]
MTDELVAIAEAAARAAGAELLRRWRGPASGLATKSSATDPASDADRAAEQAIVSLIRARRSSDEIVAEEGGRLRGSGTRWLVDPLDGTVNYLYGIPQWCVSIAASDDRGTRAAVVYDPLRDELFVAERGAGARSGERALAVTGAHDLAEALLATGFSYIAHERELQAAQQVALIGRLRDVRRFGSAALDLAWVAAGRVDAYIETIASPWDWAAGRLLVEEAGGRVTEVAGVREGMPGLLASAPEIHDALLALVVQTASQHVEST